MGLLLVRGAAANFIVPPQLRANWLRRRESQSLDGLACAHDGVPLPSAVDLRDWAPFLALD